jgi:hypothetical protein
VNVARIVETQIPEPRLIRLAYYILNDIAERSFCPGKVETWNIIIDLNGVNLRALPMRALKKLSTKMSLNYMSTLHRMFVVNSPRFITGLWTVAKLFIEKDTRTKISIYGSSDY